MAIDFEGLIAESGPREQSADWRGGPDQIRDLNMYVIVPAICLSPTPMFQNNAISRSSAW